MFRVEGTLRSETFADPTAAAEFGALVDRLGGAAAVAIRDARSGSAAHLLDPVPTCAYSSVP